MDQNDLDLSVTVRALMSALRDVMAKEMVAPKRLEKILTLVCEKLHVDTCAFYMMRPGDVLELYLTVGQEVALPPFVRLGEGNIGTAMLTQESVLVAHKTGKVKAESYVPLIKGNRQVGVLALMRKKAVPFADLTVDAVENVAMVLSEFLTDVTLDKNSKTLDIVAGPRVLEGTGLVAGVALGYPLLHHRTEQVEHILSSNPEREQKRLQVALNRVQQMIARHLKKASNTQEQKDIFETYALFLKDKGWQEKVTAAVATGLTAEAAVQKIGDETVDRMSSVNDPYLRERVHDFRDLTARLMRTLMRGKKAHRLTENTILVADSLGAAELMDYDLKYVKGLILEEGSQTMHVVIVARAYRIPFICGIKNATRLLDERSLLAMDATTGTVYIKPSDEILENLKNRQRLLRRQQLIHAKEKDKPAVTKDGVTVSLNLNLGMMKEGVLTDRPYFDGVGLYRTELLFMTAKELPNAKVQTEAYRRALVMAKGKPVVFRTLDIGSDKVLPYLQKTGEENPALGWRSIRMTLDRRALLRTQLKALIRGTAGQKLNVMFPMVTDVAEFLEAKKTLQIELANAKRRREKLPTEVRVGTMLEVPALFFELDNLLQVVDFISIGTNDLAQFIFAADRSNALIWNRYDSLSPAFLKLLLQIKQKCDEHHVPCSICGEMASKPLEALTLVGLGFTSLSMSPEAIGVVKSAIRSLTYKTFSAYVKAQLESAQPSLRGRLFSYLQDHGAKII
ncbi:MAG: phosphoenolpyruvate--protein phosphotransferase [Alphaproteobacteria bacterium]|nr:phosphoenolpyruvate--protein phosphotransferase [Alphaproteobacteria bacterium]